nr:dihydrolipoyl dehydrogenase [Rhodococcus aetherivorans]
MSSSYDVIVVGAGSAGYACAFRAAQLGLHVALLEEDKLGGTCLHRGCIPTKALLHVAEAADTIRHSTEVGLKASLDAIDIDAVHTYKDGVVDRLHKGLQGLVRHNKVDLVHGTAHLEGPTTVTVADRTLTAPAIVLATGSYPRTLPHVPLGARVITSDEALRLHEIPNTVVVLGGGVIGVEFASVWASYGADVTIVEAADRLVPAEDEWTSKQLERSFRKRGITIRTGVGLARATETDTGVSAELDTGDVLKADLLLVAVGRAPRTDIAGLSNVGVELDRGFVVVDDRFGTSVPGIYAVGDVVAGLQLAHRGFQHGIAVAEHIAGLSPAPIDETGIPRVTYSKPEIASMGLTESQARAVYDEVDVLVYDLAGNGKTQIARGSGGIKVVRSSSPKENGRILGIHMVGSGVGELIGEAQLIYNWEAHAADLAPYIHAHPSIGEALGEAHLALAGKPLHVHS